MIVSNNTYKSSLYSANNYSGVVKVSSNGYYGTGSLLYDGTAILTAAHIFTNIASATNIQFELSDGSIENMTASNILIHPNYDNYDDNNDLAIVFLEEYAPFGATRYNINRTTDELTQDFTAVGYGVPGVGSLGEDLSSTEILRLQTTNTFEILGDELKDILRYSMAWNPLENSILVADFDDGSEEHDALGALINIEDLGTGLSEGLISSGDSGGPAFIDGSIAGVASYTANLSSYNSNPDVDNESNSSFGELGFWQRVSSYEEWIDTSLRENYQNAPTSKEEVIFEVEEDAGLVYFFLELLNPPTNRENKTYSVEYSTRDGSAIAGEDYIASFGTLKLYEDETYAVIPVEIINDYRYEDDEIFYLDVTNPVGATFLSGVPTLSASRTILNDDFF